MNVLFVCTGNTCRSPMAEFLFKKMLADQKFQTVVVRSAGLSPAVDLALPENAQLALRERGVEPGPHQAKALTKDWVQWANEIWVMDMGHKIQLLTRFPEAADKTSLLHEAAGDGPIDIRDPYGQSLATYKKILSEIEVALQSILQHMK